jgi:hypothetical protein
VTCEHCIDGLRPLEWTDAKPGDPIDIAVCVCAAGMALRKADNCGARCEPLWRVWCAVHGVDPSRVFMLEQVYTPEELRIVGLVPPAPPTGKSREAAILAAAAKVRR